MSEGQVNDRASVDSTILSINGLVKRFAGNTVINNLNLDVQRGEIFTLLGASGCGKSTTLRIIAGLEQPDAGEVLFEGQHWVSVSKQKFVPPNRRGIGMVFQSYAIWPHMTVFENVAYPLRVQGKSTAQVSEILKLVAMDAYADRPAPALSGGQQQRVALARALVGEPSLLLLDEPFSNLDVHLRQSLRFELKRIQRTLGVTVILVTHDQLDAFTLSDRIGVMRAGCFEQIDNSVGLYDNPCTPFVRDFIGRNITLDGVLTKRDVDGSVVQLVSGGCVDVPEDAVANTLQAGDAVKLSVRAESMALSTDQRTTGAHELCGLIDAILFLGDRYECEVVLKEGRRINVNVPRGAQLVEGEKVAVTFNKEAVRVWPA